MARKLAYGSHNVIGQLTLGEHRGDVDEQLLLASAIDIDAERLSNLNGVLTHLLAPPVVWHKGRLCTLPQFHGAWLFSSIANLMRTAWAQFVCMLKIRLESGQWPTTG